MRWKGGRMPVHDSFGRKINYLRLSITEKCNLRCFYCMPGKNKHVPSLEKPLSFDDHYAIARAAVACGVEKIRITGGEPLFCEGVVPFLARLKSISGLKKLVLTTNGIRLGEMAHELKSAGVDSLNISIDSLDSRKFWKISRGGDLELVREGIRAAERAGFENLKLNVVVMRGVNDDEVADFAAMTLDRPYKIRFIEYMPTAGGNSVKGGTVPGDELLKRLSARYDMGKVDKDPMDGPAVYHRIAGAAGQIGFITPVSCHFCHECNRIRVTSTGVIKGCLFDNGLMNLKPVIKSGDPEALRGAIRDAVNKKPLRHALDETGEGDAGIEMSCIGG